MHKMKKKVFHDLLIFVLALFLSTGATNVLAEEEVFWESEDGNYEYKIVAENGACITKYAGEEETVILPEMLDGYPVTEIGNQLFLGRENLVSVTLPKGLTSIGEKAFFDCCNLSGIVLPDGLLSIGDEAFARCVALDSIMFPEGLKSIGAEAFSDCENLRTVTLPEGLTFIGEDALLK